MINGAHAVIFSTDAEADRAFLRDVLELPHVDVGEGWLIFGLPPSEVAIHPSEQNDLYGFHFMCEDVEQLVAAMSERGVTCSKIQEMDWGRLTDVRLPGGGSLGFYQPRHGRPEPMTVV